MTTGRHRRNESTETELAAAAWGHVLPGRHMAGSYKSIVRDFQRRFPHHVRLRNAFWWRTYHVEHQLRHLSRDDYARWSEGDQALGNYFGIWGFLCAAQAGCLEGWAASCGIDWSISPEGQVDRPPDAAGAELSAAFSGSGIKPESSLPRGGARRLM